MTFQIIVTAAKSTLIAAQEHVNKLNSAGVILVDSGSPFCDWRTLEV